MDELVLRSYLFSGDWVAILAILAVGIIYFLAPVLGYNPARRGSLMVCMWLLIFKLALVALRVLVLFSEGLGSRPTTSDYSRVGLAAMLGFIGLLESGVLILAMVLFVVGLMSLKGNPEPPPGWKPSPPEER